MPTKEQLIEKLTDRNKNKSFTKKDLLSLMSKCNCTMREAGRGSGVKFKDPSNRIVLGFDLPHPQKELKPYHIKSTIEFLKKIGEL